ncbi:MAG: TIR domain-containing protein [Candidatus Helarchaeota archaeon]
MNIFISYKWEDNTQYNGLKGLLENPNNNYVHFIREERDDLRSQGETYVKNQLRKKILKSDRIICLVGNDTHSSKWVQWELEVATSQRKKIIAIRIPNTNGGSPQLIRERRIPLIEWNADKINNALQ